MASAGRLDQLPEGRLCAGLAARPRDRSWREAPLTDPKHPATARIPRHGREGISYPLVEARVGKLFGRADFLKRVERPSKLGSFSYEVQDTKLARSPKAKFVVGDGALTPSTPDSAARCAFMLAGHGFTLRALSRNAVICPAIPLFSSTLP
jgi:hypothetical protein